VAGPSFQRPAGQRPAGQRPEGLRHLRRRAAGLAASALAALAVAAAARPALARGSSFQGLVADFQEEAGPTLRRLVAAGERVAVALDAPLPPEAAARAEFVRRLTGLLASVPSGDVADLPGPRPALLALPAPGPPPLRLALLPPERTEVARDPLAVVHEAWQRGWTRVLRVVVSLEHGRVLLRGELLVTDGFLWPPAPGPAVATTATFHAAARIDAELRALLGLPPPALPQALDTRPLPVLPSGVPAVSGHVLDLAVADLDADGDDEVLVLTRAALHVLRAADGALTPAAPPVDLAALAGGAAATSREPVGALALWTAIDRRGPAVLAATSDLAATAVLAWRDGELRPLSPSPAAPARAPCAGEGAPPPVPVLLLCGFPVGEGAAGEVLLQRAERGRATFAPQLERWRPDALAPGAPATVRGAGLGMRRRWVKSPAEGAWHVIDARLSAAGVLRLARSDDPTQPARDWQRVSGVGFAFALLDWDEDGVPELAAASDAPPGDRDALRLWTLPTLGPPRELLRQETDPLQAVAAGDLDHDGRTELLLATRRPGAAFSHLWLVRGRPP
jgi:hypothetical protein